MNGFYFGAVSDIFMQTLRINIEGMRGIRIATNLKVRDTALRRRSLTFKLALVNPFVGEALR